MNVSYNVPVFGSKSGKNFGEMIMPTLFSGFRRLLAFLSAGWKANTHVRTKSKLARNHVLFKTIYIPIEACFSEKEQKASTLGEVRGLYACRRAKII